ncbi:hypothetical protein BH11BAC3_BH11BAC3_10150 [soil metagenome]
MAIFEIANHSTPVKLVLILTILQLSPISGVDVAVNVAVYDDVDVGDDVDEDGHVILGVACAYDVLCVDDASFSESC